MPLLARLATVNRSFASAYLKTASNVAISRMINLTILGKLLQLQQTRASGTDMAENKLGQQFAAYTQWRKALVDTICDYRSWLNEQELNDAQIDQRISHLLDRLREDRLNVAFVAEFSRGKSELINAIFFADYGQRLLPSSAGRTTMCPTELMYDPSKPTSVQLLPIETRASDATTTEYKRYPDEWKVFEFNVDNNDSMIEARTAIIYTIPFARSSAISFASRNSSSFSTSSVCWPQVGGGRR